MQMTPTLFRGMVIASIVTTGIAIALDIALSPSEPEADESSQTVGVLIAVGGIGLLLAYVAALIGLLRFRWWARPLFFWGACLTILLIPFLGTFEVAGPAEAFYELTSLLEGAMIAATYWSSISGRFDYLAVHPQIAGSDDH